MDINQNFQDFLKLIQIADDLLIIPHYKTEYLSMQTEQDGMSALHVAAKYSRISLLETFISECDLDSANLQAKDGSTVLHLAVENGLESAVEDLILLGVDLQLNNENHETPLILADNHEFSSIANQLKKAISLDKLFDAAANDDVEEFKHHYLLNRSRIDIVGRKSNSVSLCEVIMDSGSCKIIDHLLKNKLTEEELDEYEELLEGDSYSRTTLYVGELFLYRTMNKFDMKVFERLLNPEYINRNILYELKFKSLLQLSIDFGSRLVLKYLLANMINEDKWVSLLQFNEQSEHVAVVRKGVEGRMEYLRSRYASGFCRLHIAVFDGEVEMVDYVLRKRISRIDEGFDTVGPAIYHAIDQMDEECTEVLIKYRPRYNYIDENGQSLRQLAIENQMMSYFETLVAQARRQDR